MPRKKMTEAFGVPHTRRGFMGRGFGKPNSYNPYRSIMESEEQEASHLDVETREDAWSGGENLSEPKDFVKLYHKLDSVREPESLKMTEARLRSVIRKALIAGLR